MSLICLFYIYDISSHSKNSPYFISVSFVQRLMQTSSSISYTILEGDQGVSNLRYLSLVDPNYLKDITKSKPFSKISTEKKTMPYRSGAIGSENR